MKGTRSHQVYCTNEDVIYSSCHNMNTRPHVITSDLSLTPTLDIAFASTFQDRDRNRLLLKRADNILRHYYAFK